MTSHFVWTPGPFGKPHKQIWHTPLVDMGGRKRDYLQAHPLKEEDLELTLDELSQKYPYEAPPDDTRRDDEPSSGQRASCD